jgi:hypothetical protein
VVAAVPDRLSRAVPFNPLKPFDRHRFANLVAPRRCAAAHFPPLLGTGAMRKSFTAMARTSIGRKSSPFSRTRPQPGLSLWSKILLGVRDRSRSAPRWECGHAVL